MRSWPLVVTLAVLAFFGDNSRVFAQAPPGAESRTPNTIHLLADTARPAATLADAAWLTGTWTGEGLGGKVEESWSSPAAGAMMGMFRLVTRNADGRDAVSFYEFLTLVEDGPTLALKLKHFHADLVGWEEKDTFVTFRLARVTPEAIYFDGLTFKREGHDRLTIYLALRQKDKVSEAVFKMTRVR